MGSCYAVHSVGAHVLVFHNPLEQPNYLTVEVSGDSLQIKLSRLTARCLIYGTRQLNELWFLRRWHKIGPAQ
ncbi:hypothetical protein [Sporomusa carbonis]|uniref:hypothetical protein n=1 Tax=Sporomusa carbonis TaxID=3076075 RepID=UPI003C7C4CBB